MKEVIIGMLLLMLVSVAKAEETMCVESQQKDVYIHLLDGGTAVILSNSGDFLAGKWEKMGDTRVFVKWVDGDSSIYPIMSFKQCNL